GHPVGVGDVRPGVAGEERTPDGLAGNPLRHAESQLSQLQRKDRIARRCADAFGGELLDERPDLVVRILLDESDARAARPYLEALPKLLRPAAVLLDLVRLRRVETLFERRLVRDPA